MSRQVVNDIIEQGWKSFEKVLPAERRAAARKVYFYGALHLWMNVSCIMSEAETEAESKEAERKLKSIADEMQAFYESLNASQPANGKHNRESDS